MKVALFNDTFALKGGTERHILDAAELLKGVGIETVYFALSDEGSPVPVETVSGLFKYRPLQGWRLTKDLAWLEARLKTHEVDVVHLVHMHNPTVSSFLAQRWPTVRTIHTPYMFCVAGTRYLPHTQQVCQQKCSIQCLATHMIEGCIRYDRDHPYPLPHKIKKLWENADNHLADESLHRIAVASAFMKDLLIDHYYDPHRIDIIHPPLTEALEALEPAPFPQDSTPTIVFSGRLIPEKGAFDAIQALMRMKTPARLIIVGDGSERPHLEADVKTLGLTDRVEFRGWIPPEESRLVYREAWLTVFPSHWPEPFGFSGIESFLNHRPTVAYNVGGVQEWLVDGENGLLISPHNVDALAQAMDSLLEDPERCQQMGAWGDAFSREKFGRNRHLEAKVRFYEAAVEAFASQHHPAQEMVRT